MLKSFSKILWCTLSAFLVQSVALANRSVVSQSGVKGGFVVHLGNAQAGKLAGYRLSDSYLVHGLDVSPERIARARKELHGQGKYGPISVDRVDNAELPYIDNFVNLIVAEESFGVSVEEMKRVLAPEGVAMVKGKNGKWQKIVKARPEEIDDWTHYFHGPSGNAVAQDTVVGPPRQMQWVGSPRWSRHHDRMASMSALVSGGGRLFYIMDEGSRVSIQLPSRWKLIARDAFNGTILWKRDISKWHHQLWPLKSGPTQLARRLVAGEGVIYVTLDIEGEVLELDAATGETLQTFKESKRAEEIVHSGESLIVLTRQSGWELKDYAPAHNVGDQKRVATEFVWNAKPREIRVFDAKTGKERWNLSDKISPLSLVANDEVVIHHDGDRLICNDRNTGKELWKSGSTSRRSLIPFNFAPRVVIYNDVVLFAGGDGKMKSFDLSTGKELWESTHDPSGYQSPQDLLVVAGLVWSAPTTSGRHTGEYTGRDPRTGEIKQQFAPNVSTYWFHHRCYLAKATENFLMPSRTGIEFVDHKKEDWNINHWVRGGCLYGVMPANGLTYAPPHNCACYPEAKLYGFNALAPASAAPVLPAKIDEASRLEKGPAFSKSVKETPAGPEDWPTFRHDSKRSGYSPSKLPEELKKDWQITLGGRLSALTIAGGNVFVAQIDQHTLHALNAKSGKAQWKFTAGGRIDSPPTYEQGRVVFGCVDGWVYCLRAEDGELIWRYRAAPRDRRVMAFEQLESVWPVHGSVLVQDGTAMFVAGRSTFLDTGLRLIKLDVRTGKKLMEKTWDNLDPETGEDIQNRLETLQMQVGLPDVLCSDGKYTYLRSQKIDEDGERLELGPISGNAAAQGAAQQGEGAHLFAPMGYLDDTYFHRAYWVYGKNFAGGHNGYYQAGKYAPAGRMMVFNDTNVYGFGREAQYLKWTTTIEHKLFSAPREIPKAPAPGNRRGPAVGGALFAASGSDPTGKAITVETWVFPDKGAGVVVAHGGPLNGFALTLTRNRPSFLVRADSELVVIKSDSALESGWSHVAGVLGEDKSMRLYLNGELVAEGKATGLISSKPKQGMDVGIDSGSSVGNYKANFTFTGLIDELRVFHRALSAVEIAAIHRDPEKSRSLDSEAAVASSFEKNAQDRSGKGNHGKITGVDFGKGKVGSALWFRKGGASKASGSHVAHDWARTVPMFAQAMAMAGDTLIVAGPPDVMDEEYAFERIMEKDESINSLLREQDQALQGAQGGKLWAVSVSNGRQKVELPLKALPVWDGMAVANKSLFVATKDGKVTRFGN
jgi:outer membrane protein assembly factor BamB